MHDKVDIGYICNSLKNSIIRKEVYAYICNVYPKEVSVREIAIALDYPERNVWGALIGEGKRYKQEDSLVGMGLVEYEEKIFTRLYYTFILGYGRWTKD